jgi:hypothetical protein
MSNDPKHAGHPVENPAAAPLHDSPAVSRDETPEGLNTPELQSTPPAGPMTFASEAVLPERVPAVFLNPVTAEHLDSHNLKVPTNRS